MKVTKVLVLLLPAGADKVVLETDLPCPVMSADEFASFKTEVARGHGEFYAKKHFPDVPLEVIDARV